MASSASAPAAATSESHLEFSMLILLLDRIFLLLRQALGNSTSQILGRHEPHPMMDDDTLTVNKERSRKNRDATIDGVALFCPMDHGKVDALLLDVAATHLVVVA